MNKNNFIFHNSTKVYFGNDQLGHLGEILKQYGDRVLLVYGGGSIKKNGLYDKVMKELKQSKIQVFELSGVEPNPRHTTVNKGAAICKEQNIDVLLAVGGGSTIDCTKGIAATALAATDNVWDLVERKVPYTKALPIVTILTMAATGSEMDTGAVISNMDLNIKSGIMNEVLRPKVSFENPENTFTVPKYQTACGSVDIMSHIFDVAYFSEKEHMEMLKRIQEEVLNTVIKWAPIAYEEPENYDARANLMWASSWALNDFLYDGGYQNTVCHSMEHELSAYYDITHGHGLAILTPRWLSYILDENTAPAIQRFGVRCFDIDPTLNSMEGAKKAIEALSDFFFNTLELKSHLADIGIDDTKFSVMAYSACNGGTLNSIKPLTQQDIEEIYKMCL